MLCIEHTVLLMWSFIHVKIKSNFAYSQISNKANIDFDHDRDGKICSAKRDPTLI